MINILLDENMPFELMPLFEKFQFMASHVKKLGKTGIKNGEVYQLAKELKAWIITRDRDFLNIAKFQLYQPEGVIFIKVKNTSTPSLIALFKNIIENKLILFQEQHLLMIEEQTIRIII